MDYSSAMREEMDSMCMKMMKLMLNMALRLRLKMEEKSLSMKMLCLEKSLMEREKSMLVLKMLKFELFL